MNKLYGVQIDIDVFCDYINIMWGSFEKFKNTNPNLLCPQRMQGITFLDDEDSIFVYVQDIKNNSVLVHELIHAAWRVIKLHGLPNDAENNEVEAYIVSHVIETLEKRIKSKDYYEYCDNGKHKKFKK